MMANLIEGPKSLTPEWHEERRKHVTASNLAALMGDDPYRQALDLYNEMAGLSEPFGGNWATRFGQHCEEHLADWYQEETGEALRRGLPLAWRDDRPEIAATLDALTCEGKPVEFKTATRHMLAEWGDPGTDEIPARYVWQCQAQMAVYDADECDVCVLLAGTDREIYTVRRSQPLIDAAYQAARKFLAQLADLQPPEADPEHESTMRALARTYRTPVGEIHASLDLERLIEDYEEAAAANRAAKKEYERAQARLAAAMAGYKSAALSNGDVFTRNVSHIAAGTFERKAYDRVTFSRKKTK